MTLQFANAKQLNMGISVWLAPQQQAERLLPHLLSAQQSLSKVRIEVSRGLRKGGEAEKQVRNDDTLQS